MFTKLHTAEGSCFPLISITGVMYRLWPFRIGMRLTLLGRTQKESYRETKAHQDNEHDVGRGSARHQLCLAMYPPGRAEAPLAGRMDDSPN